MDIVGLTLRWLHIFPAVALGGGVFYWAFVVAPAVNQLSAEQRDASINSMLKPWARVVMISSGLLVVSGLFNAVQNISRFELPPWYHGLVAAKLVLGLAVMWISAKLAGRSESAGRFRQGLAKWAAINALLVALLIGIGGGMKMAPRPLKQDVPVEANAQTPQNLTSVETLSY